MEGGATTDRERGAGRDPVFARSFEGSIALLFDELPQLSHTAEHDLTLLLGPGVRSSTTTSCGTPTSPKRLSLDAVRRGLAGNLGQPPGEAGSEQRLLFVDWPVLDRHKHALAPHLDGYLDLTDPDSPRSLDGEALRRSLRALAAAPFRTRPTFLPGPWECQWLRRALGVAADTPSLAWSYELITPESGILLGAPEPAEVGFELLMAQHAEEVLGEAVAERFGSRSRSGSTTSTPSAAVTSPSSATRRRRICARPLDCRTHSTRPTT